MICISFADINDPDPGKVDLVRKILAMIIIFLFFSLIFVPISSAETIVVESRSMMHSDEPSSETLDPGDVIEVIEIDSRDDIITYVEGKSKGYKKFGDYGDVIIYKKNGEGDIPVIHRPVCWIEFNDTMLDYNSTTGYWTGGAYDIPELNVYGLTSVYSIPDYGYGKTTLMIDFRTIIDNFANVTNRKTGLRLGFRTYPHSGFLTKGDSIENVMIDQNALRVGYTAVLVEPIKVEWINGKVRSFEETILDIVIIYLIAAIIIGVVTIVALKILYGKKKTEDLKYREGNKGSPSRRYDHSRLKNTPASRHARQAPVRRVEPNRIRKLSERKGPRSPRKRSWR